MPCRAPDSPLVNLMPSSQIRKPLSLWFLIGSLYTTQYLGLSFFTVALVAILREQGASLQQTGTVYLLGMIGACKFLWAPLVDRLRFPPRIGRFRGWLLLMQSLLVLVLVFMSSMDVSAQFGAVYALCALMAFCGATQDIATDGLVCTILTPEERGVGNGIQTAGGMFGFMIGAGLVLMIYPSVGWRGACLLLAAGTAVSLAQLVFFKEPGVEAKPLEGWRCAARLASFWRQPGMLSWLGVLIFFPMGITAGYALLTPLLVDGGWHLDRIGLVVDVLGPAVGMAAGLLSGWLISRLGRRRVFPLCVVMQFVSVLGILVVARGHMSTVMVAAAVIAHFLGYVPTVTLLCTLMMDRTSPSSPATDYTVQYSAYQFIAMGVGGGSVALAGHIGYEGVVYAAISAILLGALAVSRSARRSSACIAGANP